MLTHGKEFEKKSESATAFALCRLQDCLDSQDDEDGSPENFSFAAQQVAEFAPKTEG